MSTLKKTRFDFFSIVVIDILLSKNAVIHLHSKSLDYLIRIQQKDDTLLKMT